MYIWKVYKHSFELFALIPEIDSIHYIGDQSKLILVIISLWSRDATLSLKEGR